MEGYKLGKNAKAKAGRYKKAHKISRIINQHKPLKGSRVLEVGTGAGYIAHALSKEAKTVDSVDITDDRLIKTGYRQTIVKDETLPFKAKSFDIVITNHVLEHVPDQVKHLSEIRRVLKDDGLVYLASPNKWWLTDPHYKLPFISWLPRPVSGYYLRIAKGRKWDIYSVSLRKLHSLADQAGFKATDTMWTVLSNPAQYDTKLPPGMAGIIRYTPKVIARGLLHIVPTHIQVLTPKQ